MEKRAYVTVLTSTNYLDGVRTLLFSLNKVESAYPLVVVVPEHFDLSCQQILKAWGCEIVEYPNKIVSEELKQQNKRAYWNDTFFKLCVFDLVQYEKIIYIDLDMILLQNIDHLFENDHISAVQGGKLFFHWEDINSGLMVIKPNHKEFTDLINLVPMVCQKKIEVNEGFGDQDVISYYYKYINRQWEGKNRLDERYNAMIRCIHELCVEFGYNNIKIIHFTGKKKPWMYSTIGALKYVVKYILHHERYRALCAFTYFKYVFMARRELQN